MRSPRFAHKLLPKLLEYYPPFWIMGVRIKAVTPDFRKTHLSLPLKWYAKNTHGTMFGGYMCAVSDPVAAIMCGEIFRKRGVETWTKAHSVTFMKPGRTALEMKVEVTDEDLAKINNDLDQHGRSTHVFEFFITDKAGVPVAKVQNTVFLRIRPAARAAAAATE